MADISCLLLIVTLTGAQTIPGQIPPTKSNDIGIAGIFIRFRDVGGVKTLDGSGNLSVITVTDSANLVIPVFSASC